MAEKEKKYYRKQVELYDLLTKVKLWPSRTGKLHGIKTIEVKGDYLEITTHCGQNFRVKDSKKSRAARWLRNKWMKSVCKECKVPEWKIEKFSRTFFTEHYGSDLKHRVESKKG